ncbi:MAG: sulfite exporter TauE/SafE family protein, partial [Leptospiraceae bacterium]|nr:sulfite exporter TauE/SafE family protein [Leptospiraceae bacterium]
LIGAGGSKFFSPIYMYFIGLTPIVAIVVALFTQSFGFASGSFSYYKQGKIDFVLSKKYLSIAIPLSVFGSIISHYFSMELIETIFGIVLILNSFLILYYNSILNFFSKKEKWNNRVEYIVLILGSLFLGFISVGLGELIIPTLLLKYKYPTQKAVGTSVFIVFVSTFVSVIAHIIVMQIMGMPFFVSENIAVFIWMIPGAITGAQFGARISAKVSTKKLKLILTVAFILLGSLILFRKWIF